MSTTLDNHLLDELEGHVTGSVLVPDHPDYDAARAVHNGLVDRKPALIVRARSDQDIMAALAFARSGGFEVSVRGGGHNVAGRAVTDGGVMIDLAEMKNITLDPERGTAETAEGGVTWNELNEAAAAHGLAVTGGAVSTTRYRGLHPRRWPRLANGQIRARLRQPRGGRAGHRRRRCAPRVADGRLVPGPVLGVAWRRRQLRRRNIITYRLHPLNDGHRRSDRATDRCHAGLSSRFYRDATAQASDDLTVFAGLVHAPDGSGASSRLSSSATPASPTPPRGSSSRFCRLARPR